jgi:hypothetical protein
MEDGIPTLVANDEPYHIFRAAAERSGLHCRVLSDGKASPGAAEGSAQAKQQPLLLAFALDLEQLPRLPPVPS